MHSDLHKLMLSDLRKLMHSDLHKLMHSDLHKLMQKIHCKIATHCITFVFFIIILVYLRFSIISLTNKLISIQQGMDEMIVAAQSGLRVDITTVSIDFFHS